MLFYYQFLLKSGLFSFCHIKIYWNWRKSIVNKDVFLSVLKTSEIVIYVWSYLKLLQRQITLGVIRLGRDKITRYPPPNSLFAVMYEFRIMLPSDRDVSGELSLHFFCIDVLSVKTLITVLFGLNKVFNFWINKFWYSSREQSILQVFFLSIWCKHHKKRNYFSFLIW